MTPCAPFEAEIPTAPLRKALPEAGHGRRQGALRGRPAARRCRRTSAHAGAERIAGSHRSRRCYDRLPGAAAAGEDPEPAGRARPALRRAAELRLHPHRRPGLRLLQPRDDAATPCGCSASPGRRSPTTSTRRRSAVPSRAACRAASTATTTASSTTSPATADLADKDNLLPGLAAARRLSDRLRGQVHERLRHATSRTATTSRPDGIAGRCSAATRSATTTSGSPSTASSARRTTRATYMTDVLNRARVELLGDLAGPSPFYLQLWQSSPRTSRTSTPTAAGPAAATRCRRRRDSAASPARSCRSLPACPRARTSPTSPRSSAASRRSTRRSSSRSAPRYQCRLETLPAVDRGIADDRSARCARPGSSTTRSSPSASDNGNFHGQHRLPGGKGLAYEEAAHVPFVIRVPGRASAAGAGAARGRRSRPRTSTTCRRWSSWPAPRPARRPAIAGDGRPFAAAAAHRPRRRLARAAAADRARHRQGAAAVRARHLLPLRGRAPGSLALHPPHRRSRTWRPGPAQETERRRALRPRHATRSSSTTSPAVGAGSRVAVDEQRLRRLTDELSECAGIEGRDPEPERGQYCR